MVEAALGASYTGYLFDMLRTLGALAGVCLLAWLILRALARRGFGAAGTAPVRVMARVPLDTHSSLHVVRAGPRVLLIGVGRGAAPSLLGELDPQWLDPQWLEAPVPSSPPSGEPRGE